MDRSPAEHPVEVVAHRGAGRDGTATGAPRPPENTMPALRWGWARVGTCELDVHRTADGEVVGIHDATTGRTCNRDLDVATSTLEELLALDVHSPALDDRRGQIPELREVLEQMPRSGRLYVELKHGTGLVAPVLAAIADAGKEPGDVVLISFALDACAMLKQVAPAFAVYWVVWFEEAQPGAWRVGYQRTGPDGLALETVTTEPANHDELLRLAGEAQVDGFDLSVVHPPELPAILNAAGVPWGCWTVDDPGTAVRLAAQGAFQITSNQPQTIERALRKAGYPTNGGAE